MHLKHTGRPCIVYSKSDNKYHMATVCINKKNKIEVYKYGQIMDPKFLYGNIDLRSNIVNLTNNTNIKENSNNIIFYNGEEVKVVIVSEKKYDEIFDKV